MKLIQSYSIFLWSSIVGLAVFCQAQENLQPPRLESRDGMLEVTLRVGLVESLGGTRVAPGYNGAPIGPTLVVKPEDKLIVTLINELEPSSEMDRELHEATMNPEIDAVNRTIIYNRLDNVGNIYNPTYGFWGLNFVNIHFHGLGFSSQIEQMDEFVDGGKQRTYEFEIPKDQELGVHWYHNHIHGTAAYAYMCGLFGFIIVEGDESSDLQKAPGVNDATEVLLMLSEGLLVENSTNVPPFFPIVGVFDWVSVANGFRTTLLVIGDDGLPLPNPFKTDVVSIEGGERKEFLVTFNEPGTYTLFRGPFDAGVSDLEHCQEEFSAPFYPCVSYDVEQEVLTVVVTGEPIRDPVPLTEGLDLPGYPESLSALAEKAPVDRKTVTLETITGFPLFQIPYDGPFIPPGTGFGMNGRFVTPLESAGTVTAGTCEKWYILNIPATLGHPFHVHQALFMITHEDGVAIENPIWEDTAPMTAANVTIHICFHHAKPGDTTLAHCHMPSHLDIGMLAFYDVVAPTMETDDEILEPESDDETGPNSAKDPLAFGGLLISLSIMCLTFAA